MFWDNVDNKKIYSLLEGINTIKTEKRNEHINKSILPLLWHWAIFTTNVDRKRDVYSILTEQN